MSLMFSIDPCYLTGSRVPRFDPTAYIQDRQRRLKEAEFKKLVSIIFPFTSLKIHLHFCWSCWDKQSRVFCARLRKVRRDMLTSPTLPERGRSRSRDAYPQGARSGSRGRSLSVERRGSRNSSESSLVDMDEMAKSLFR